MMRVRNQSHRSLNRLLEQLEPRTLLSVTLPNIANRTFNITSYGASTSSSNNASAIQKAINAAHSAGGGTVAVPSGTFLSGALSLSSNVNLNIASGSTLRMLSKSSFGSSSTPFISVSGSNIEISGSGTIDGQGAGWWSSSSRPDLIKFSNSNIIEVTGVKIENSPKEHLVFSATNNVTINHITIATPSTSPNTDGIDPAGSHYLIENSNISTGDDDIAIKPQHVFCSDITITGMTIGSGHGISVGGQTNDGLNGLTVTNTTFNGTTNGLRLKAGPGFGGLVQNVSYSNITMNNVQHPIYITSWYANGGDQSPSDPSKAPTSSVNSTTPIWKNISYNGITVTGASEAGILYGRPEELINTVHFNNVHITAKTGMKIYYATGVVFTNSAFKVSSGPHLLTYRASISGTA